MFLNLQKLYNVLTFVSFQGTINLCLMSKVMLRFIFILFFFIGKSFSGNDVRLFSFTCTSLCEEYFVKLGTLLA